MEYQVQVPLGTLPINLVLIGNKTVGKVAFVQVRPVGVIIENGAEVGKIGAMFFNYGFHLIDHATGEEQDFDYNHIYEYKEIPAMLKWLQQQNLQEPQSIFG